VSYDSWKLATPPEHEEVPCDAPMREYERGAREAGEALAAAFQRITWQYTLAHNLATAAGLCRAFQLGYNRCASQPYAFAIWEPGCKRSAP
jgi:hypothetical protein